MFTNHNIPQDLLNAAMEAMKVDSDNLPQDLREIVNKTAEMARNSDIYEERTIIIQSEFNKHDVGYADSVRIAFENEVLRKI